MPIDLNRVNPLTEAAIGATIKVHRALGPGLLESVYQACLVFELQRSGMSARAVPCVTFGEREGASV